MTTLDPQQKALEIVIVEDNVALLAVTVNALRLVY